jgi:hypothetical protein
MPNQSHLGPAAVVVQGDNAGSINTGVILNIQGDDAEKNLAVARALLAASLLAPPLDPQRKADIVALFQAIAGTLTDAVAALRQGQVPHGKCGELHGLASHLPAAVGDAIGEPQAQALGAKLLESYDVERFGAEWLGWPEAQREEKLAVLEEAAGHLRAAAMALRVKR